MQDGTADPQTSVSSEVSVIALRHWPLKYSLKYTILAPAQDVPLVLSENLKAQTINIALSLKPRAPQAMFISLLLPDFRN